MRQQHGPRIPEGFIMSRHRSFATAIAVLCLASPLAAQAVSQDTSAVSVAPNAATITARSTPDPLSLLTPTWTPAWTNVGVTSSANATALTPTLSTISSRGPEGGAMMIVGGAALLVGAVIGGKGGTVIMVGGGVLGLFGLWTYLR
jgi:hypothetical protein